MNDCKLISVTPDAEKHIAYCARVSNPSNQDSEKFSGLIKYCIKHQHWSIFEQAFHDSGDLNYQRTSRSSPAPSLVYISRIFTKVC